MSETNIHPIIRQHLKKQGVVTKEECEVFLKPSLNDLPSPFLLKDMGKAVDLVKDAIKNDSDILIWGDYDVDGITSTALLFLFFKELKKEVLYHIPDRLTEGYGLNKKKIDEFSRRSKKNKLLITVDCGISNHEEVEFAQSVGISVIITDHHTPPAHPVTADAIINPNQIDCGFPFNSLAGVGVSFYFAAAVRSKMNHLFNGISAISKPNMKYFLGFVSLGTIADVMPLKSVNRILVKGGFESISAKNCLKGLRGLFDNTGVDRNIISSEAISFQIAPTINAAGRLGEPLTALNALIADNGDTYSEKLILLNKKRKKISSDNLEYALTINRMSNNYNRYSTIINGEFHDGIMGITASKLVELFNRPAIVMCQDAQDSNLLKASARAPEGFDLYKAIDSCSRFLNRFGGHKAAAGLTLNAQNFDLFNAAFDEASGLQLNENVEKDRISSRDFLELSVSESLNSVLLENICQLEPLGESNPKPIFVDNNARFVSKSYFGKNREHVRGVLRGKYKNIPVLGFSIGEKVGCLQPDKPCSVVYSHMLDHFRNSNTWKLKIQDIWQIGQ